VSRLLHEAAVSVPVIIMAGSIDALQRWPTAWRLVYMKDIYHYDLELLPTLRPNVITHLINIDQLTFAAATGKPSARPVATLLVLCVSLRKLTIDGYDLTSIVMPTPPNVVHLKVKYCTGVSATWLRTFANTLEKLNLNQSTVVPTDVVPTFPHLRSLHTTDRCAWAFQVATHADRLERWHCPNQHTSCDDNTRFLEWLRTARAPSVTLDVYDIHAHDAVVLSPDTRRLCFLYHPICSQPVFIESATLEELEVDAPSFTITLCCPRLRRLRMPYYEDENTRAPKHYRLDSVTHLELETFGSIQPPADSVQRAWFPNLKRRFVVHKSFFPDWTVSITETRYDADLTGHVTDPVDHADPLCPEDPLAPTAPTTGAGAAIADSMVA
jgi:hypothetical protein